MSFGHLLNKGSKKTLVVTEITIPCCYTTVNGESVCRETTDAEALLADAGGQDIRRATRNVVLQINFFCRQLRTAFVLFTAFNVKFPQMNLLPQNHIPVQSHTQEGLQPEPGETKHADAEPYKSISSTQLLQRGHTAVRVAYRKRKSADKKGLGRGS